MPITGRTGHECFDQLERHISRVVAKTVPGGNLFKLLRAKDGQTALLSFRGGDNAVPVQIRTGHGDLYLYLAQLLEVVRGEDKLFRLRTRQYWYRLQCSDEVKDKAALLRWEYTHAKRGSAECRHHLHAKATIALGAERALDLDELHLPTGWVRIEEASALVRRVRGANRVAELDLRGGHDWIAAQHRVFSRAKAVQVGGDAFGWVARGEGARPFALERTGMIARGWSST